MATMFPCPNCNGQLIFSPKSGKLKCTSCGHYYKSADYKSPVKIDEAGMDTRIYICPNCAGEIQLIDNDGMEFCPYCGTQATMEEKFSKTGVPKYIIPFTIHIIYMILSYTTVLNIGESTFMPLGIMNIPIGLT